MGKKKKKGKIRADFRKKHDGRVRRKNLTRDFQSENYEEDAELSGERYSGKGDLTRKRTIVGEAAEVDETGLAVHLEVDLAKCQPGRVLSVHGLASQVEAADGQIYRCAVRGVLKSLSTDQRNVVVAGDRVQFQTHDEREGVIERVEPRRGVISRTSRGRQHVIVANVDQLLVVVSAGDPPLKPNLIDRFLVTAEKSQLDAVVCINKIDLVEPSDLQPLIGVYGQMGYRVVLTSATSGIGIERLQQLTRDKQSVFAGQSGVGKSSLLNALEEGLDLRVREVSDDTRKGRHTTTSALLLPLSYGGYVVDTPGVRQFQLWDVIREEVAGFFRDMRPYVSHCRFPDCTHIHEDRCAVKDAVADCRLDARRYESYVRMFLGDG